VSHKNTYKYSPVLKVANIYTAKKFEVVSKISNIFTGRGILINNGNEEIFVCY